MRSKTSGNAARSVEGPLMRAPIEGIPSALLPDSLPSTKEVLSPLDYPLITRVVDQENDTVRLLLELIDSKRLAPSQVARLSNLDKIKKFEPITDFLNTLSRERRSLADVLQSSQVYRQTSFLTGENRSLSEYEVFNRIARVSQTLTDYVAYFSGESPYHNSARLFTASTERLSSCGYSSEHFKKRTPAIAWSYQGLDGGDPESVVRFLEEVLSQRRFGYFEFLTGQIVVLGGVSGMNFPMTHRESTKSIEIITGYEVLVALQQDKLSSFEAPSLLSPVLREAWYDFYTNRGWEFGETQGIYLPFEFSRGFFYGNLSKYYEPEKHAQSRVRFQDVQRGIRVCEKYLPGGEGLLGREPLLDYLGRQLWDTVRDARKEIEEVLLGREVERNISPRVKKFLTRKVVELEKRVAVAHPKEALLKLRRDPREGENVLVLPEADALVKAPLIAKTVYSKYEPVSYAVQDLAKATLAHLLPRTIFIEAQNLESVAIATTNGKVLFENIEHLYSYWVAEKEWLNAQVICSNSGASYPESRTINELYPRLGSNPEEIYLTEISEGSGYIDSNLIKRWKNSKLYQSRVARLHHGLTPYLEGTGEIQKRIRDICSLYPALWPLFYSKKIDERTSHSDRFVVDGFANRNPLALASLVETPQREFDNISKAIIEGTFNERQEYVYSRAAELMQRVQKTLNLCGMSSVLDEIKKKGEVWSSAPSCFQGKKIIDQEGNVVAENVGHLMSQYLAMAEYLVEYGLELAGLLRTVVDSDGLKAHMKCWGCISDVLSLTEHDRQSNLLKAYNSDPIRAQLRSLNDKKVWQKIHNREIEVIDTFPILNEICQQLFGASAYSSQFDHWIQYRSFTDPGMRFRVRGDELLKFVNNEIPNTSQKPYWRTDLPSFEEEVLDVRVIASKKEDGTGLSNNAHIQSSPLNKTLRQGLNESAKETYLAICDKYPSLSALFFPRKNDIGSGNELIGIVKSAARFAALIEKSPDVAYNEWKENKHRFIKQNQGDLEAAKIFFVQQYGYEQRDIFDFFRGITNLVFERANISAKNWSTVPKEMNGVIIVDFEGWVFAENFGHFVTIHHDLTRFLIDRERELAERLRIELLTEESSVAMVFGGFHEILWLSGSWSDEEPDPFLIANEPPPSLTLPYISKISVTEGESLLTHLDKEQAEILLKEACVQLFGTSQYSPSYDEYLLASSFCNPERTLGVTGKVILSSFKEFQNVAQEKVLSKRERRIIEKQKREERKRSLYLEMFRDKEVPLGTLFFALCAIGGAAETKKGFRQFKEQVLPKLPLGKKDIEEEGIKEDVEERSTTNSVARGTPKGPVATLHDLFEVSEVSLSKVDLSAIGRARLKNLLYQLCYRSYRGDTTLMLGELNREQSRLLKQKGKKVVVDLIIHEILPELLTQIEQERDFKVPKGITFTPFGYQRSAVASVWEGISSLIVGSVGSGKTEMAAMLLALQHEVEIRREKKRPILLLTTPTNRRDTFLRISELITSPTFEVRLDAIKKNPSLLSDAIEKGAALHCSYATLSALHVNHPDLFNLLMQPALVVADEGQQLSNHKSRRSLAVKGLQAGKVAVMSATPAQHQTEEVASPLGLSRPDLYPDVDALKSEFRRDRSLALALYHQHSVIVSLEDVAHVFKPFDTVPAKEQLEGGLPCIPALVEHEVTYRISAEHTRRYINFALGKEKRKGGSRLHRTTEHLRRLASLKRLHSNPVSLGAPPAFALVQAVKEIALPAMQKGEKVVILGEHLALLELLAEDPEIKAFGGALLTGASTEADRSEKVRSIVEDSNVLCLLGQMQVLGVGHNLIGVKHVIFLEPPKTVSSLLQGIRHRRVVTLDTLSNALDKVYAWYLKAELDSEVVELIKDVAAREIIKRGSIYRVWFDRLLVKAKEYAELTNHPTTIRITGEANLAEIIENLVQQREELARARAAFTDLQEEKLREIFFRYRSPGKTEWRNEGLHTFVKDGIPLLYSPKQNVRVALLPGPEALEIPVYLEEGIVAENIFAFEAHADEDVRLYCKSMVQRFGARFFGARMEQVLPQIGELVDILSIDTNGYIVPELISLIATWRFPSSGMLLKNSLCGREQGGAFSLLASVDGDRKKLDKILLWIAGSQADSGMRAKSPLELVNYALRMESVSSIVAHRIAPLVGLPHQSLVDLLIALGLNGPLTRKVKIVEYSSEGGSPFLSNFALLDKLNPISSRGESIGQLRDFLQAAAESFVTTQASISLDTVKRSKSTTLSFTCPGKPHAKKVLILPKDIKEFAEAAFR